MSLLLERGGVGGHAAHGRKVRGEKGEEESVMRKEKGGNEAGSSSF